jgi:type IV pilus assembly protein PilA
MFRTLKMKLKDQRGLTLIELLAVVVILGIIAAIAIPAIGKVIDNTKVDAHIANASQMVSAAKMAASVEADAKPALNDDKFLPLAYLQEKGFLDAFTDPDGTNYVGGTTTSADAAVANTSYVKVTDTNGKLTFEVALYGSKRHIAQEAISTITRDDVDPN